MGFLCHFGGGGGGDDLLWESKLRRHVSGEYSIAVAQANSSLEDQAQVLSFPKMTLVGIYDGHGGPETSRFLNSRLFAQLQKFAEEHEGLSEDVIKKAFSATEEEFFQIVKEAWLKHPQLAAVGSCCLMGAIADDVLFVANCGDSRAVLGRSGSNDKTVVAERLTSDHNVALEEVRKELIELHPDDSHIVIFTRGVWRVKGIIQVSRSIGDIYLKKPEYGRDPLFRHFVSPIPIKRAVMSAEPSIKTRRVRPSDLFLIFASDGLWEQLSDEDAVNIVFKNPRKGIAKRLVKAAINAAAKKQDMNYDEIRRIEKGVRRRYHDDISVVVIYLDHNQRDKSSFSSNYISAPVDIYGLKADNG